jgi:hypothetical protein
MNNEKMKNGGKYVLLEGKRCFVGKLEYFVWRKREEICISVN